MVWFQLNFGLVQLPTPNFVLKFMSTIDITAALHRHQQQIFYIPLTEPRNSPQVIESWLFHNSNRLLRVLEETTLLLLLRFRFYSDRIPTLRISFSSHDYLILHMFFSLFLLEFWFAEFEDVGRSGSVFVTKVLGELCEGIE